MFNFEFVLEYARLNLICMVTDIGDAVVGNILDSYTLARFEERSIDNHSQEMFSPML